MDENKIAGAVCAHCAASGAPERSVCDSCEQRRQEVLTEWYDALREYRIAKGELDDCE
jgi:uncharacterized OB-fold protein